MNSLNKDTICCLKKRKIDILCKNIDYLLKNIQYFKTQFYNTEHRKQNTDSELKTQTQRIIELDFDGAMPNAESTS